MSYHPTVIVERRGVAGIITLNRPEALNALNQPMVDSLTLAFAEFAKDDRVDVVVMRGAGDKAFCAGGDVRTLREAALAGHFDVPYQFWFDEYRLNRTIARFKKPVVALMHGVVMGGGVGLGLHASHRVGAESFLFAMPEVGIGFFPDVGGAAILNGLAGQCGRWLALTGARLQTADAYALGLISHVIERQHFETIVEQLCRGEEVDKTLKALHVSPQNSPVLSQRAEMDRLFASDDLEQVVGAVRLAAVMDSPFALSVDDAWKTTCPLSVALTNRHLIEMRGKTVEDVLVQDLRLAMRMIAHPNFAEGIRAQLVDRDRNPKWQPAGFAQLDPRTYDAFFEPLQHDLIFA